MVEVILILISGYGGFYLFKTLKLPSPVILGPLVVTAAANMLGLLRVTMPSWAPMFFTIGVAISVTQDFELKLKGIVVDLMMIILYTLGIGLGAYYFLCLYGMDPQTAFFSAMPGGGTDLALIALGFQGADPFRIVLYQTIRFFAVVFAYPVVLRWLVSQKQKKGPLASVMKGPLNFKAALAAQNSQDGQSIGANQNGQIAPLIFLPPRFKSLNLQTNFLLMSGIFVVGVLLALGLKALNFGGGNYVGGMVATMGIIGILKKKFRIKPAMSRKSAAFFKVGACSILGLQVTADSLNALIKEWPALVIMSLIIIISGLLLGWLYYRMGRGDLVTCMLETAPSGVLPMSVLAEEMQGDVVRVSLFQVLRIIFIVMLAPIIGPYIFY